LAFIEPFSSPAVKESSDIRGFGSQEPVHNLAENAELSGISRPD
jgi:hypothetical protein